MRNGPPRRLFRLVRDLRRLGYGVYPLEERRMSTNDVKGLAQVVNDEVKRLRDKTQSVRDELTGALAEAHEVVEHVGDMTQTLKGAVNELRSALGQTTNGPPVEEPPEGGKANA